MLNALQEVEDNLALLHWLRQAARDEDTAVAAAQRSVTMALTLYRDGAENYLQVIIAQTAELSAEQTALDLRTRRLQASIGLIRATGGGWTTLTCLRRSRCDPRRRLCRMCILGAGRRKRRPLPPQRTADRPTVPTRSPTGR